MRCLVVLAFLTAAVPPVMAQPMAALVLPGVTADAEVSDYLRAAQGAVAAKRTAEAEEALEMAQTRMLDRSVPLFQTRNPSDNPVVGQISRAREALRAGDRDGCLRLIQAALASAQA